MQTLLSTKRTSMSLEMIEPRHKTAVELVSDELAPIVSEH
ncbi:hypothetical protein JCM19233_4094 [Vibrio astriarenae]|nr:hypothetical protein JCM19233_4094 [Vibrio sp. C7]